MLKLKKKVAIIVSITCIGIACLTGFAASTNGHTTEGFETRAELNTSNGWFNSTATAITGVEQPGGCTISISATVRIRNSSGSYIAIESDTVSRTTLAYNYNKYARGAEAKASASKSSSHTAESSHATNSVSCGYWYATLSESF